MNTIVINRIEFVIEDIRPAVHGGEVLWLGRMGKRGRMLKDGWCALRAANGTISHLTHALR